MYATHVKVNDYLCMGIHVHILYIHQFYFTHTDTSTCILYANPNRKCNQYPIRIHMWWWWWWRWLWGLWWQLRWQELMARFQSELFPKTKTTTHSTTLRREDHSEPRANGVLSHCFMPLNKSREGQLYLRLVAIHCFQTCTCLMGYIPHSNQANNSSWTSWKRLLAFFVVPMFLQTTCVDGTIQLKNVNTHTHAHH